MKMGFISKFKKIALRGILVFIILALLSYLINATHRGFYPGLLFGQPMFVLEWLLTMPLLVGYAALIAWAYNAELGRASLLCLLLFLGISLIQVAIVQTLLFATTDQNLWFADTAYLRRDYPFFGVPLLAYLIVSFWFPECRLYRTKLPRGAMDDTAMLLQGWRMVREPHLLLTYLRACLPPLNTVPEKIRLFDIVLIKTDNQLFEVYLSDGRRWVYTCAYKKLMHAILSSWFIKTDATHYVNMLYADIHRCSKKNLALDPDTFNNLLAGLEASELRAILQISRHLQNDRPFSKFCEGKHALPDEGWETNIADLIRE